MKKRFLLKALSAVAMLAFTGTKALAQLNPGRPVRIVVPLPAGTATDQSARTLGQQMSQLLGGQSFIVDNKAGGGTVIGAMDVVRAAPDGHTLLFASVSTLAINMALVKNVPYDPRRDFTPIAGFGATTLVLMVRPSHPAKTLQEFISHAKQNPGKVSVGYAASVVQVQIAAFDKVAGTNVLAVPYKGIPAIITDMIGGTIDASWIDLANAMTHAKAGSLRPLAVTTAKRSPLVPDWPSVMEVLPGSGFDYPAWFALVGPAGMPKDVADKLSAAAIQALSQPGMSEKLASLGMAPMPLAPEPLRAFIAGEIVKWTRSAADANIQPQ
ncbi:Bug family tripartite tricarboxylate transporter substrate binding protein [Ramlibacter sp.]|uniref:Bug family tripartite tricarboxylate transporter substrate binding protein n=1 Tax=Ramlibacter sp. TaxID=1917967 RepID=UPI003D0AAEA1